MKKLMTFIAAAMISHGAAASVVINQTRVIYPASAKFVSVQLVNSSNNTHLVQSWIDNGDPSAAPETLKMPFALMPSVAKIAGNSGQTLKIAVHSSQHMPDDRESVYWLNVLDVPPVPEGSDDSYLQVAIRNRIKLFYRPSALPAPDSDTAQKISVAVVQGQTCLKNDTPYYMTLPQIVNWQGGTLTETRKDNLLTQTAFIAPFDCLRVSAQVKPGGHYRITWLDDFGSRRFSLIH